MTRIVLSALLGAAGAYAASKTTYTYKTVGECAIQADVYRAAQTGPRPVVLWIHGGALVMGDRSWITGWQVDRYTSAGFTVVAIDYRLAPETKLPSILEDVSDAYQWVREKGPGLFGIDPGRIAVVGHSAGGYLTLTAGYRFQPRPLALVAFYGYGDIVGDWYTKPDPFYSRQPAISKADADAAVGTKPISGTSGDRDAFYLYTRQHGIWPELVAGVDPRKHPRTFHAWCPLRNVSRDYPSTLLLHGDHDTDVPFEQSELMAAELQRNGVEHEFIRIPGGEHGFDHKAQDREVEEAFRRVIEFLQAHGLKPSSAR
ncbi:MAG: alpha/beta hydrolase [Bryobacteraceae bacterium]